MDNTTRAVAGASAIGGLWLGATTTPERMAHIGGIGQSFLAVFILLPAFAGGETVMGLLLVAAVAVYLVGRTSRRRRLAYVLGGALMVGAIVPFALRTDPNLLLLAVMLLPGLLLPLAVSDAGPRPRRRPAPEAT